jgi:predicted ATP-dependent endonuclease of OLD family
MKKILLFVEGETDKIIIKNILIAAKYPIERIDIEVSGGKTNVIQFAVKGICKI